MEDIHMVKSPLTEIREQRGYTKNELGMILNISETTVKRIEIGASRIPERSFNGLQKLGFDPVEVVKQQENFIEEMIKKLLEKNKTPKIK